MTAQKRSENTMDLVGKLLIAMPGMTDPRFAGALILVCVQSSEGAMGLILNRPNPRVSFRHLLAAMGIDQTTKGRKIRVQIGGPVERSRGFVLHGEDYGPEDGTVQVTDGVRMTTSQDVLRALGSGAGPRDVALMLGYAGWGPGQIEAEIGRNDWLTAAAKADLVFAPDNAGKWGAALRSIGVDPLALSSVAGRA